MKKYGLLVAVLVLFAACNGKRTKTEEPVVIEEDIVVEQVQPSANVNMRDSLVMEDGKGSVIERKYSGLLPGADVPGIEYDLTLFFQQDSENGVYQLRMNYLEADDGSDQSFYNYGKRKIVKGIAGDPNAIVYKLIPNDGGEEMNFVLLKEGDLRLLDQDMNRIDSELNYTLKLIK